MTGIAHPAGPRHADVLPENHPLLHLGRAARIEVTSEAPLCVHADGEFFCVPADGITEVTAEVLLKRQYHGVSSAV